MKPLTRRIIGVVVVLVLVGVGVLALRTLPVLPSIAARQITADLTSGQLRSQAWTNPDDGDDLAGIVTDLAEAGQGTRRVTVDGVDSAGGTVTATLRWDWEFASAAGDWSYSVDVPLRRSGALWTAEFDPRLVHPDLGDGEILTAERTAGERGRILGADDAVLVAEGEVIDVGLQPSRLTDEKATLAQLEKSLDIDPKELAERVEKADPDAFVPVITLRKDDYELVKGAILELPGTVFRSRTQPLARTKGFAAATLGSAGRAEPDEIAAEPESLTSDSYV
ncbi:cell division protein FtsI, partial [Geobacillus sp. MMMUD3]|nr:cell division protein FtsI [Geobacillus sp. MMMUD3]